MSSGALRNERLCWDLVDAAVALVAALDPADNLSIMCRSLASILTPELSERPAPAEVVALRLMPTGARA